MVKSIFALLATVVSGQELFLQTPGSGQAEVSQAGTLAVTWSDCGAKHATVDDLSPTSIKVGGTSTLTGTGTADEDVTSAQFTATIKAAGVQVASCSGDATSDITCKLPTGAGSIVVKAVFFPLEAGRVNIPVAVSTSALIPASLAAVDVHIEATDQSGESVICLDVHTKKADIELRGLDDGACSTYSAICPCCRCSTDSDCGHTSDYVDICHDLQDSDCGYR